MPKIRTLTLTAETPTLSTFSDPLVPGVAVFVTTEDATGIPTAVEQGANVYALANTTGITRAWTVVVDGKLKQVNTFGTYPGLTANAAG